jgi:hypothetical protein
VSKRQSNRNLWFALGCACIAVVCVVGYFWKSENPAEAIGVGAGVGAAGLILYEWKKK